MKKMNIKSLFFCAFVVSLCLCGIAYAQTESITLTTYYPSPYGSYNDLQTMRMAVGDTNGDGQLTATDLPANNGELVTAGNVGIGTRTPQAALEISSTADGILRLRQNEAGQPWNYIEWYNSASRQWWTGMDNAGNWHIGRDAATGNFIVATGNVGIGTGSPGARLSVVGLPNGPVVAGARGPVCADSAGNFYVDIVAPYDCQ